MAMGGPELRAAPTGSGAWVQRTDTDANTDSNFSCGALMGARRSRRERQTRRPSKKRRDNLRLKPTILAGYAKLKFGGVVTD